MVADKNMDKPLCQIIGVRMPSGATMWLVGVQWADNEGELVPCPQESAEAFKLFQTTNQAVDFIMQRGWYRPVICNGVNAASNGAKENFNKKGGR